MSTIEGGGPDGLPEGLPDDDAASWAPSGMPPLAEVVRPDYCIYPAAVAAGLERLHAIVKEALSQKGDDVCWRDIYNAEVAGIVGVEFDPELPPKPRHMANCDHFYDCLAGGTPYAARPTDDEA
jgi:hypothetical protein